jgi:hypothetical protein
MTPREDTDFTEAGNEVTRKTAERGRETVRRVTEQVAKTAKTVADARQQTANASAEAMRRNAEGVSQTLRSGTDFTGRIAERSFEQFSQLFGFGDENGQRAIQQSFQGLRGFVWVIFRHFRASNRGG